MKNWRQVVKIHAISLTPCVKTSLLQPKILISYLHISVFNAIVYHLNKVSSTISTNLNTRYWDKKRNSYCEVLVVATFLQSENIKFTNMSVDMAFEVLYNPRKMSLESKISTTFQQHFLPNHSMVQIQLLLLLTERLAWCEP